MATTDEHASREPFGDDTWSSSRRGALVGRVRGGPPARLRAHSCGHPGRARALWRLGLRRADAGPRRSQRRLPLRPIGRAARLRPEAGGAACDRRDARLSSGLGRALRRRLRRVVRGVGQWRPWSSPWPVPWPSMGCVASSASTNAAARSAARSYPFNPLGYVLSFTFMTDSYFAGLVAISAYCYVVRPCRQRAALAWWVQLGSVAAAVRVSGAAAGDPAAPRGAHLSRRQRSVGA